jgi:tripartite-type tricarboxylate transporter receptor subunit TctC
LARLLALLFVCALALPLVHAQERAPAYPSKPIRMIMPFSPGGGTDLVGRLLAKEMTESLGQPVVADNRTGAGGLIGIETAARANPDGYTVLFTNQSIATNESVYSKLKYNALRDFAPVSRVGELQFILAVNPALPVASVKDLTAYVKARPGKLSYASGGLGGVLYFAMEMYKNLAGLDIVHVPYRGGGDAATAVVANQVQTIFVSVPAGIALIQAGRLKPLAITGTARSKLAPDIPTMIEAGVAGYEFTVWNMMLAPVATPKPVLGRLHATIVKSLQSQALVDNLAKMGVLPGASASPAEAHQYFATEVARYAKLVKQIGLKID